MKKIQLLFLFTCCIAFSAVAQKRTNPVIKIPHQKINDAGFLRPAAITCDALNYNLAPLSDYNVYLIENNNGFVIGTNSYADHEEAATFTAPPITTYLTKIIIGFAYANSNVPANLNKTVNIKVYDLNASGNPQNVLATVPLVFGDIKQDVDESLFTTIIFPTALPLPADKKFAVSVDISGLEWDYPTTMDSLGLWTLDTSPELENYQVKFFDGTWLTSPSAWDLDVALMIFPYVSDDPTCLEATPVTLSSFIAQKKDGYNQITWTTSSEQNNTGFDLERSIDGNNFTIISTLPSKAVNGNSNKTLHYSYQDNQPYNGINYYRLSQKDKDGRKNYSQAVSVNNLSANAISLSVYPNPVMNVLNISLNSATSQKAILTVMDLSGRKLISETKQIVAGENRINLNVQQLQSGNYLLKITVPNVESKVVKFVK